MNKLLRPNCQSCRLHTIYHVCLISDAHCWHKLKNVFVLAVALPSNQIALFSLAPYERVSFYMYQGSCT